MDYLITGASGFVAGHLIEAIFRNDSNAVVTAVDISEPDYCFLDSTVRNSIQFVKADLFVIGDLTRIIKAAKPHFIVHLAAFSSVAYSWKKPTESFKNNLNIFLNLLEAVRQGSPEARILSVGSSEQYGTISPDRMPLEEGEPPNPVSPYAVARVAQEQMASVYVKGFKTDIVITRSFNHFGPRQDERFVLSSFAKQVAEIKKGNREPIIHVGDLSIIRDFTDVRDVVKAYLSLLDKGIAGEIYNVCSGTGRELKDCLNSLIKIAGVRCEIQKTVDLIRPVDNPVIVGDNTKIRKNIGWQPETPFEVTLQDTYEYWTSKI